MKLSEKIKNYIVRIVKEESEDLKDRENRLEENVRNLNAAVAGNTMNLNAVMEDQEKIAENVRNLNALIEDQEKIAENVRNLNTVFEGYNKLVKDVNNLNGELEILKKRLDILRNSNDTTGMHRLILEMRNEECKDDQDE